MFHFFSYVYLCTCLCSLLSECEWTQVINKPKRKKKIIRFGSVQLSCTKRRNKKKRIYIYCFALPPPSLSTLCEVFCGTNKILWKSYNWQKCKQRNLSVIQKQKRGNINTAQQQEEDYVKEEKVQNKAAVALHIHIHITTRGNKIKIKNNMDIYKRARIHKHINS